MPDPTSEPLFGAAFPLLDAIDAQAADLTLEELRIVEHKLKQHVRRRQVTIAQDMRLRGCTWYDVGRGLGMSAQAAHQRFGPVCVRPDGSPTSSAGLVQANADDYPD